MIVDPKRSREVEMFERDQTENETNPYPYSDKPDVIITYEQKEDLKVIKRCRDIVIRKIEGLIALREKNIKSRSRRNISILKKLREDIVFLFDNPNYVRVEDRKTNEVIQ